MWSQSRNCSPVSRQPSSADKKWNSNCSIRSISTKKHSLIVVFSSWNKEKSRWFSLIMEPQFCMWFLLWAFLESENSSLRNPRRISKFARSSYTQVAFKKQTLSRLSTRLNQCLCLLKLTAFKVLILLTPALISLSRMGQTLSRVLIRNCS